mmetsp:Transcript_11270/g.37249  ORF Transcript_11270/g.37249 Transcript_11270/m.37249 type:complete len:200 (-) Transcript_11270:131-730(-)
MSSCAGVALSKSQSPSVNVSSGEIFEIFTSASPGFAGVPAGFSIPGGFVAGACGGVFSRHASASAFTFGFNSSISSMHAAASASYAKQVAAFFLCAPEESLVQSRCRAIVSTTKLQYAINTRNSSCQFSSCRYTLACNPTKSAVLKYTSKSIKWFTGFERDLTASDISRVVRGREAKRSIILVSDWSPRRPNPRLVSSW